jgi:hypothetical protein
MHTADACSMMDVCTPSRGIGETHIEKDSSEFAITEVESPQSETATSLL